MTWKASADEKAKANSSANANQRANANDLEGKCKFMVVQMPGSM